MDMRKENIFFNNLTFIMSFMRENFNLKKQLKTL